MLCPANMLGYLEPFASINVSNVLLASPANRATSLRAILNRMPTLFSQLEVAPMPLVLSQSNIGPVTLLELSERLTIENVPELRDTLQSLADQGRLNLLLDCSRVSAVDSQGIGSLVGNWVSLKNRGGKLKLLHPSARLNQVLQIVGLRKVIESFDDIGQALRSF
jgi:anti-sigma B factor antagonist